MVKRFGSIIRIIVALFLSVFMTNFAPVMTANASHHTPNHEAYWENLGYGQCTKIENPGGTSYTLPAAPANKFWSLLVVKASEDRNVYPNPTAGVAYDAPLNNQGQPRDVSHVIFCHKPIPPTKVTPTAPTKVDPCGRANDGYTIPAVTGVKYFKWQLGTDPELSPGFHAEDDSAYIYAEAQSGYELTGTTSWWLKDYTNALCSTTPAAPTKTEVCGTADDKYTIPTTAGVIYKVNNVEKSAGTYAGSGTISIKAYAKPGYVLSGDKEWSFTFSTAPCIITVTPTPPTSNEACGVQNDTFTIPAKTGVIYKVNGTLTAAGTYNGTGSVTITAWPADATYVLDGDTEWTFDFDNAPCPVTVQTVAPSFDNPCATAFDMYTLPNVAGVTYEVNGTPKAAGTYSATGHIEITALPAAAHITLAGDTTWEYTFTDVQCVVVVVNPLQPCVDRGTTNGEFTVEVTNNTSFPAIYEVYVDGVAKDDMLIFAGDSYTFTLSGYGPGTYDIDIEQYTFLPFSPAPVALTPNLDFPPIFNIPPFQTTKTVFQGSVTLKECPQVLGDSTGHTSSTSTTRVLAATLPNTGSDASLTSFIALLVGLITYTVIARKTARVSDQA